MASITTLPLELINALSIYLNQDDLLSLRITCKNLDAKVKDSHLDAIFHYRRVFLVPASLENLIRISRHPTMNQRVRHIQLTTFCPYRLFDDYSMEDLRTLNPPNDFDGDFLDSIGILNRSSRDHLQDLEYFEEGGEDIALLTLAFSNLPNIQKIEIGGIANAKRPSSEYQAHALTRSEFNILFPSMGMKPGSQLPKGLSRVHASQMSELDSARLRLWRIAMFAAISAPLTKLQNIKGPGHGIMPFWFISPPSRLIPYRTSFPKLRILDITVVGLTGMNSYCNTSLLKWLEAVWTNLENLKISNLLDYSGSINIHHSISYDTTLPTFDTPTKLKRLALHELCLNREALQATLTDCRNTLEFLRLENCKLNRGDPDIKTTWFKFLKFLRRECVAIRELVLVVNYTTCDEGGHMIPSRLESKGKLGSEESSCEVTTAKNYYNPFPYTCTKNLGRELDSYVEPDGFWDSLTDGHWKMVTPQSDDEDFENAPWLPSLVDIGGNLGATVSFGSDIY
ncbi:hypothetical protein TWF694_006376 [Orbilia ellipsospora]|uniref:F-box domain-containing protein n=1 Tax=Orbilia ellipsospora TaxID=2528407 RepID=A0AAV9XLK1_9PEZI